MARPVKQRKILAPHSDTWFFPVGNNNSNADCLLFLAEEFEAIKLIDYEGLNHSKAGKLMKVSRPTFTRIYKRARIKLSTALVEKKVLKLSGGNIYYSDNWHKCQNCDCIYNVINDSNLVSCPLCKSKNFINIPNPE